MERLDNLPRVVSNELDGWHNLSKINEPRFVM